MIFSFVFKSVAVVYIYRISRIVFPAVDYVSRVGVPILLSLKGSVIITFQLTHSLMEYCRRIGIMMRVNSFVEVSFEQYRSH